MNKYLYCDSYRGGVTNIKIKLVYAKMIADALDRELIFIDRKMHSGLYKFSTHNISYYFDLTDLGKVVYEKDIDFSNMHEFKFKGGSGSTYDSLVNRLAVITHRDVMLRGDMILSRKSSGKLVNHLHKFSCIRNKISKPIENNDICLHLRSEIDWKKKVELRKLINAIKNRWKNKNIFICCEYAKLENKDKIILDDIIKNDKTISCDTTNTEETYEMRAETDFQRILKSNIFVGTTRTSTFTNLACLQRDNKETYIYEKGDLLKYNVSKIY